jgi:hypothetical protein
MKKVLSLNHFRHDATSTQDGRMLRLRGKYGYEGIGVFWHVIETLYLNDGTMEIEALRTLFERNTDVLEHCIFLGLLVQEGDNVFSKRLNEEIAYRKEKSEKSKKAVAKRWRNGAKKPKDTDVIRTNMPTYNERNTSVILGEERRIDYKKSLKKATEPTSEPPTKKRLPATEQATAFFKMAEIAGWCEHTYTEAKTKQFYALSTTDREDVLRKMRVACNSFSSSSASTKNLARKVFHETVGLIQDRALDKSTLTAKSIESRRQYADSIATSDDSDF